MPRATGGDRWKHLLSQGPGCARVSSSRASRVVCPMCVCVGTRVFEQGVTRGLPRVCVYEHTHSCVTCGSVAQAVPPCVCALVCITAQLAACPGPAHRVALAEDSRCRPHARFREEAQTEGVCFPGGAGRGHISLPTPGEEYCSGNS